MTASLFLTYLITVAVLTLTPGPDMMFCLATGLKGGPRAGFQAALGTATGEAVHVCAAAAGLSALLRAAPEVLDAVRLVGAGYLVLLGIRAFRRRDAAIERTRVGPGGSAYVQGLVTDLLNPKMVLFSVAFLPQFVDRHAGGVALQFATLGACLIAFEIVVDGTVGLLAGRLSARLCGPRVRRTLNVAAGTVFLTLGARIALK